MAEEDVVAIPAPSIDHKRKLDEVDTEVPEEPTEADASNGVIVDENNKESDCSQSHPKRTKLDDEAVDGLDNGQTQGNGSPPEVKAGEHPEEEKHQESKEEEKHEEPKEEETEKLSAQKDENQDREPVVEEIKELIIEKEPENKTCDVDQPADEHVKLEDNQQTPIEAPISQEGTLEEDKDVNGGSSQKEVGDETNGTNGDISEKEIDNESKEVDGRNSQKEGDDSQSTTRRIEVPSSKVGVLIGKGGETIRYLQFNSGAKIQILRDSEADPSSVLRPVEIIGTVACIESAEKLISAVIAEAEAGGSPALVARGLPASHSTGIPEQIEIKVPNDKVGLIIGRGGETIKNMQTRSGARIQLIPQHAEGDGFKERTVRISGDKRQIDIATEMIKDVMYQNARSSNYSGGFNQPPYRPRGPGGPPPQWGSRGSHAPHPMPYDYPHRGSYSSQGSHYNPPGYSGYPPQHMPPRSGYGAGWDQRPSHSGPYDYYGRQGPPTSGPHMPPAPGPSPGPGPSPALGPPPSQTSYGYGQTHGPDYGHAAPYSQAGPQQTYGQMYEQPKYDNPPMQPPYGGHGGSQQGYPPASGGQPGYSQMQQPGRPYGMQGPVQQGYGPPRPAATSGDVPYQSATSVAPTYGNNMAQQQQYPYAASGPAQQTYSSYSSAVPSDGYNGTQTPAAAPAYQQQGVQPASTHDGSQQAAAGYGQIPPTSGYSSYQSSQPAYGSAQAQNSGSYGYTGSQDPSYGGGNASAYAAAPGSQPAYSQAAPTQAGYEQPTTQQAGYAAAPGSAPVKTQSPQPGYAQYDTNQVYAAPR